MAGILSLPTTWSIRANSSSAIKTPINVNNIYGPFAFLYIISYSWSDGDYTYYEYGIIRRGYSGNNVSKEVISERVRTDISFSFSYSTDGYITVVATSTTSYPAVSVRIIG